MVKIQDTATLLAAAQILFQRQISGLLVVNENDRLVGLLSEKDIYRALYPEYRDFYLHPEMCLDYEKMESKAQQVRDIPVKQLMSTYLYTVSEDDPVMKVGAIMLSRHVNRLPVLNKSGVLVGVVSRREIYQAILQKEFQLEDNTTIKDESRSPQEAITRERR